MRFRKRPSTLAQKRVRPDVCGGGVRGRAGRGSGVIIPYNVDVPMARIPVANWILIGITCVIGTWGIFDEQTESVLVLFRGEKFSALQLIGNLFGHADFIHLIGNMVFLFVFGNAINAKLGHGWFLGLYFGIGIAESLVWLGIGTGPATLGASGAIMGIVGAFLALYPRNDVSVFYWFGMWWTGTVAVSSYWVILLYFSFDLIGLLLGGEGVNYIAHISGWMMGLAGMYVALKLGWVARERGEETILDAAGHHETAQAREEKLAREIARAIAATRGGGGVDLSRPAPRRVREEDLAPVELAPELEPPPGTGQGPAPGPGPRAKPAIIHDASAAHPLPRKDGAAKDRSGNTQKKTGSGDELIL